MSDLLEKARAKIAALKAEIVELERFISMYEKISGNDWGSIHNDDHFELSQFETSMGNKTLQNAVDNSVNRQRRMRNKMRPDHVADLMARIIRDVGRPLTRGDLVEAFEKRDVQIPFEDKERYIGTIAWRNKGLFRNIPGYGYWLADLPPHEIEQHILKNQLK